MGHTYRSQIWVQAGDVFRQLQVRNLLDYVLQVRNLLDYILQVTTDQGCISCGTCSYPELTEDHVLTSAYVKIFRTVTRNAVNKSV